MPLLLLQGRVPSAGGSALCLQEATEQSEPNFEALHPPCAAVSPSHIYIHIIDICFFATAFWTLYIYMYNKIHIHMIMDYRYVCDITCKLLNSKAGAAEHRVQRPTWKTSPAAGSLTKPCRAGKLAPGTHFQRSTKVGPVDKPGDLGKAGSGLR